MKLSSRLRRTAEAESGPTPGAPPPPPAPPRGSAVSAYAGILDGQTLWLAVEADPGTLALRDAESGDVHTLRSDLAEDDPAYRSVRADLLALPGDAEATYDVVLVPASGRAPRPVWTRPLGRAPMKVPPTRSGAWQFSLGRAEDGTLRVLRRRPEPGCDVLAMELTAAGVRLTLGRVDATDPAVLVLDGEDVVATYAVTREGDALVAVLAEAGLPEGRRQLVRLVLGSAGSWLPLRRWHNEIANPNPAVLLPQLHGADPDVPRLRLRYAADGTLGGRLVDLAGGDPA